MSQQSLASNMSAQSSISTTESYQQMFEVPNNYYDLGFKSQTTLNSRCSSVDSGSDEMNYSDKRQLLNNVLQSQSVRVNPTNDGLEHGCKDNWLQSNTLPKRHSQGELNICINATLGEQHEHSKSCIAAVPGLLSNLNKHKCSSLEFLSTSHKNVNCFNQCKLPKCSKKEFFANGMSTRPLQQNPLYGHTGSAGNVTENGRKSWDLVEEIWKACNLKDFKCLGAAMQQSPNNESMQKIYSQIPFHVKESPESKTSSSDYVNEIEMNVVEKKSERTNKVQRGSHSFRRSFTEPNFSTSAGNLDADLPVNAPLPGMDFSVYDGNKKEGYLHQLKYPENKELNAMKKDKPEYMNCQLKKQESSRHDKTGVSSKPKQELAMEKMNNTYMNLPCIKEQNTEPSKAGLTHINYAQGYHDMKAAHVNKLNTESSNNIQCNDPFSIADSNCKNKIRENTYENIQGVGGSHSNSGSLERKNPAHRDYENVDCLENTSHNNEPVNNTRIPIDGDLFGLPATYKCYQTAKTSTSKSSQVGLSTKVPLERESTYMITSFPEKKVSRQTIRESDYMLMQPSKKASPTAPPNRHHDISDIDEDIFCAVELPIRRADSCKTYQSSKTKSKRDSNYLLMNGKNSSGREEPSYMEMNLNPTGGKHCTSNGCVKGLVLPMRSQSVKESSSQRPKFNHSKSLDCEIEENYLLMDGNKSHHCSKSSGEIISEDQSSHDEDDDDIKVVEPFENLIQPKNYSAMKVTLPPKVPPREPPRNDVPNRHNSLKSTHEMEKHVKNRKFAWFQRRNSREQSVVTSNSKSNSKSQESILSSSDGAKELSNSAPCEQTFMRPRSGSADLLSMPVDVSRERSASVPNKTWLGPVISSRTRAGAYADCHSMLTPAGGNPNGMLDEAPRSRSSSDASNASTDLPPPLPPRNPALTSKNKLNTSGRSITPPSAASLLASSTPNDTSRASQPDSTSPSLHISEESLNLSGGSSNSSNSTASTGIDTSSLSSTSHSFASRSANWDSSKPRLPQRHSSVRTYQPEPVVVKMYTRHGSLERTNKSSRPGLMSNLRRGSGSRSKKPPALMVEIPQTTSEENGDCNPANQSGCVWVERTMPKSGQYINH